METKPLKNSKNLAQIHTLQNSDLVYQFPDDEEYRCSMYDKHVEIETMWARLADSV